MFPPAVVAPAARTVVCGSVDGCVCRNACVRSHARRCGNRCRWQRHPHDQNRVWRCRYWRQHRVRACNHAARRAVPAHVPTLVASVASIVAEIAGLVVVGAAAVARPPPHTAPVTRMSQHPRSCAGRVACRSCPCCDVAPAPTGQPCVVSPAHIIAGSIVVGITAVIAASSDKRGANMHLPRCVPGRRSLRVAVSRDVWRAHHCHRDMQAVQPWTLWCVCAMVHSPRPAQHDGWCRQCRNRLTMCCGGRARRCHRPRVCDSV